MEHQNNGQHPIEDADNRMHPAGNAQNVRAPLTLVSAVLSRLALEDGKALPLRESEELIAALDSSNWHDRAAAIRTLEKTRAAKELFVAALNDEDSTVRAAAIHALGTGGGQTEVALLTAALRDPDWHVRETAALVLGKLTQDVPLEPLFMAQQDPDGAVREAAQLALQWRRSDNTTAPKPAVGAIEETSIIQAPTVQQGMQTQHVQELQLEPDKQRSNTFRPVFPFWRSNTAGQPENREKQHMKNKIGEHMQEQEYEKQELQYYGYGEETTTRWDKVTSYKPERKHRNLRRVGIVSSIVLLIAAVNVIAFGLFTYITQVSPRPMIGIIKPTTTFYKPIPTPAPALGNTVYTFRGHQDTVNAVAWSPNSTRVASASDDQTVQVWDAITGGNKVVYGGHLAKVTTVAWSPDGSRIASGDLNGIVQIWNPANGNLSLTYHFQAAATISSHIGALQATSGGGDPGVYTAVWSPDGKNIAAAMGSGLVRVFDARTGRTELIYSVPSGKVNALSWSPNGKYIVVAGNTTPTTVWDTRSGQTVFTYPENDQDTEFSLAWSPNSKNIALGTIYGTVRLWNPFTNNILAYKGQSMNIYSLAWSPDGTRIASGSIDNTVQVWNANTLTTLFTYRGHSNEIRAVSWSPNGTYIASGSSDQTVQVWQAKS
jgi:WD40 repeat protein